MPLPVIAKVVRVASEFTTPSGKNAANVWHYRFTGAGTPATADFNNLSANHRKIYVGAAIGTGVPWFSQVFSGWNYVQDVMTALDGISPSVIQTVGIAGSLGGTALPSEVAAVLTLRTAKRGRRFRGRIYLPALTTAGVTASGFIANANITGILAQWAGALGLLSAANWLPCVASYKFGSSEDITNVTMDNRFDVQRRRK